MRLYEAADIKIGDGANQVIEVRHGIDIVWSAEGDPEGIWVFNNPSSNDTINVKAVFFGRSTAHWGDGNTNELTSNTTITHTY
jgi:hypothetical protein